MTERLFIFGLGFSGLEIARLAKAAGWSVADVMLHLVVEPSDESWAARR
jgi:NAD/NADP transhydrogenase alpha subunit